MMIQENKNEKKKENKNEKENGTKKEKENGNISGNLINNDIQGKNAIRPRAKANATAIENIFTQASSLSMYMNAKLEEISYWRTLASKADVIFSAVKSNGSRKSRSRLEDCVCKIAEIEESLQNDMTELIGLKEKTMRIINRIDIPEYRSLLIHRYVCGKKWDQVAESMGYSYVHIVNRLHPKALKKLSEIGIGPDD